MWKKVLLVDDEPVLLSTLRSFLEGAGHRVLTAMDAGTALELVQAHGFDAIVCDLRMPGMDGLEFCQEIRKNPAWKDVRLVVLTGGLEESIVQRGLKVGVQHFLAKPFAPEELLRILQDSQSSNRDRS
jgi:CheY-like chemotaxis protein